MTGVPTSTFRMGLPVWTAAACAVVALLSTALFFLLHYVGNQLPYDLAVQRFKAELESAIRDEGNAKAYKGMYEYCELSGTVLAGARKAGEGSAFRDAVILKALTPTPDSPDAGSLRLGPIYCGLLEDAVYGAAVAEYILKPRYWWGNKALYAIALRHLSVHELREFTRIATRVAYLLLGISLLLLSPKTLLLTSPLLVFGAFFSGIEYWADVANGLPYLWTVLAVAGLALLMRGKGRKTWPASVPVYCFAAGTVSSYLWLGDGHTFLVVTWIGMLVWFGLGPLNTTTRARRTLTCIALYGAGIVVCYMLGQAVRATFLGAQVWWNFWEGTSITVQSSDVLERLTPWPAFPAREHVSTYHDRFYAMVWPGWLPAGIATTSIAACSLVVSLGLGFLEARRGRRGLLRSILWIFILMAIGSLTFLIWDGYPYRTARYVSVPLALCLSALVLSVATTRWRMALPTAGKLSAVSLGAAFAVCGALSWYLPIEARATARLIDSVAHMKPVLSAAFDVYLDGDRLVYVKEECADEDVDARFFMHVEPVDAADLPDHRRSYGFDNLNFSFRKDYLKYSVGEVGLRGGGRCAVERALPDYEIAAIETGQFVDGQGRQWSGRFSP